jgi:lysozyme family protein
MALFDHEFATSKQQKHTAAWPKCLGAACVVALIGFVLLGIGVLAGIAAPTAFAVLAFALAGAIAAAGGAAYFFYERSE